MNDATRLLVCPITKQNLLPLSVEKTALLLKAMKQGRLSYFDGEQVSFNKEALAFLVSENQQHIYSVVAEVPILLEAKKIELTDVAGR